MSRMVANATREHFLGHSIQEKFARGRNYRGVQLTPVLPKVCEWIVADFLIPFLEKERRVAMGTINGLIEKVEALAILYHTSLQRCNAPLSCCSQGRKVV